MEKLMTTCTELYSYNEAWARAAELQRKGYVTRVWFDGRGWSVKWMSLEEWEVNQNEH